MTELVIAPVEALLFDVDGTLCDSKRLHYQAWAIVVERHGIPVPAWPEYVERCLRGQRRFEELLDLRDVPASVATGLHQAKSRAFREIASMSLRPATGIIDLWLHARALGLRLGVVSTARRRSVTDIIELLRLPPPDVIVSREDVDPNVKPDPAGYRVAAELLQLPPDHCVVFEDSPPGIQAAIGAQMPCVAFASTLFSATEQSGARLCVERWQDVTLEPLHPSMAHVHAVGTIPPV